MGRLERESLIPLIEPALSDSSVEVRAAAADAVAQASVRGRAIIARNLLTARLRTERNVVVRAALLEAVGRLAQGSAETLASTANVIAPSLASSSPIERRGAIRGIFFLSHKAEAHAAGRIPVDVTDRVYAMLMDRSATGLRADDLVNLATILSNTVALNDARTTALFGHDDPYVRDRAVTALGRTVDTATVRAVLGRAMADTASIVRYRSIGVYARRLRAFDGCAPLIRLGRDRDVTVALASVDALSMCTGDSVTIHLLDSLAGSLREGDAWHLPAHAFVSLSVVSARRARELLPRFAQSQSFFVRMYADTAARLMGDTAALYRLAVDPHPNVRSSAIAGLSALVGHAADSLYVAALQSDDNQLLMTAAGALIGSKTRGVVAALGAARSRLRNARPPRQTSLDGYRALDKAVGSGGGQTDLASLRFPTIASPTFDELAKIEQTVATIEMADGSVITFRFHPFDAPTNSARFIRLAKGHAFDGLTFHRVVPFFVVQGPGPNANEYSAPDGSFTRDELGRENLRGTIGLSTRGRDTGDGQIFINTVDNTWLDHEYTVMATITRGLDAVDRMQEGARIKRITVSSPSR